MRVIKKEIDVMGLIACVFCLICGITNKIDWWVIIAILLSHCHLKIRI